MCGDGAQVVRETSMAEFVEDPDVVKDVRGEVKAANVMRSTDGASAMGYK